MNVHVTESTYARNLRHCRRNDTPRQRARRGRMRCWAHFVATALFVCGLRCLEVACNLGRQPRLGHGSSVARAPPGTAFLAAPGGREEAGRYREGASRAQSDRQRGVGEGRLAGRATCHSPSQTRPDGPRPSRPAGTSGPPPARGPAHLSRMMVCSSRICSFMGSSLS